MPDILLAIVISVVVLGGVFGYAHYTVTVSIPKQVERDWAEKVKKSHELANQARIDYTPEDDRK